MAGFLALAGSVERFIAKSFISQLIDFCFAGF